MRALVIAAALATLATPSFAQKLYNPDLACESKARQACFYDQEGKDNAARRGTGVSDYCAQQAAEQCAKNSEDDSDD